MHSLVPSRALDLELLEVIDAFRVALLTTQGPDGMHARPMMVGARDGASLWLPVHLDDAVVQQVRAAPRCSITFQGSLTFVTLVCDAEVVRERSLVAELWSDTWAAFLPGGVDDPDVALLHVRVRSGRVWDLSGARGVSAALRVVGSAVSRGLDQSLPAPEAQEI